MPEIVWKKLSDSFLFLWQSECWSWWLPITAWWAWLLLPCCCLSDITVFAVTDRTRKNCKKRAGTWPALLKSSRSLHLSSFDSSGLQAACADMHPLGTAVDFALYPFDIRFPYCIGLSIRMAYIMTELNAFPTNITLSHLDTSSNRVCLRLRLFHNISILTEIYGKSKQKNSFFNFYI